MMTDIINKKLELLKRLKEAQIVNYSICWDDDDYDDVTVYTLEDLISLEDIVIIEKTLTPPTADEVCEALSDYYGKEVIIDKRYKNTVFAVKRGSNVAYMAGNKLQINQALPPHLITLIGRFYEGELK